MGVACGDEAEGDGEEERDALSFRFGLAKVLERKEDTHPERKDRGLKELANEVEREPSVVLQSSGDGQPT